MYIIIAYRNYENDLTGKKLDNESEKKPVAKKLSTTKRSRYRVGPTTTLQRQKHNPQPAGEFAIIVEIKMRGAWRSWKQFGKSREEGVKSV